MDHDESVSQPETPASDHRADCGPDQPITGSLALMGDLVRAEDDILELARRHRLELGELARWAIEPATRQTVVGLCLLADLQTQLMLSRYRLVAASRLIAQATAEEGTLPAEQVRRACVDLLKIELDRASSVSVDDPDFEDDPAWASLCQAMAGDAPQQESVQGAIDAQSEDRDPPQPAPANDDEDAPDDACAASPVR